MTQAGSRPTLAVQLISMQSPEAANSAASALSGSGTHERAANDLLLHPGEPGEMLVKLENSGDRSVRWQMVVQGDFPSDWCDWHQEQPKELAPNQKEDITLRFRVPDTFFEDRWSLSRDRPRLQVDYQSQIYVYTAEGTQQPIGYQVFNLCVRPRSSYINFLPALYRHVDFVRRFVTIFEQAYDPAVQTVDVLWAYLDPLTAPEALLPFLAHWVAWPLDSRWELKQQRRLIRNAIALYRWHGTRRGLRFYLHLYTGLPLDDDLPEAQKHISIEEIYSTGFVVGTTSLGQDSMLGGGRPYHFLVRLRCDRPDQVDERLVRDIIEREKPAFCTYELEIIVPDSH